MYSKNNTKQSKVHICSSINMIHSCDNKMVGITYKIVRYLKSLYKFDERNIYEAKYTLRFKYFLR